MSERFKFGPFVLDGEVGALLRDGAPVRVSHRGMLLLTAFAREPEKVLSKSELTDAAWPGLAVEEGNLTVQIASLRKVLGPGPNGGEWIVTVPRVGYRFVGEIVRLDGAKPASPPATLPPSVAVLPFDNMSGDPEQDYFADGVAEDIITALSRFRSFAVIARNSSFVYKGRAVDVREVARDLGVRYVLEGSVRRAGDRLRITAQLIDAGSGAHLWADRFDGDVKDVFEVQDRITESVAAVVEPEIREAEIERSKRERPGSIEAYDLYLQALPRFRAGNPKANAAAYTLLVKATAIEPDNGIFLAEAARVLERGLVIGWPPLTADDRSACINLARRGLANAHGDASVIATCGLALIHANAEYELGLATLRRATEANPNQFRVLMCAGIGYLHCGNLDDALACLHRAVKLSPASPGAYVAFTGIAHAQLAKGKCGEAVEWAQKSLALSSDYQPTYWILIAANAKLGLMQEASRWRLRLLALAPEVTVARIKAAQPENARVEAMLDGLRLAGLAEG